MADSETAALQFSESVTAERYRVLLALSNAIIACQSRDEIIQSLDTYLQSLLAFDRVSLSLYDWEKGTVRFFAVSGGSRSEYVTVGRTFALDANYPGLEFDRSHPILRGDLSTGTRNEIEERIYAEGSHSYCIVPLTVRDYIIGTLNVVSRNKHQYSQADAVFLQEIAQQISLAVWNLDSYEKLRAEVEQRRQIEESLRASEEFKTRLIEGSHDCIKVLDLEGRLLTMNAGGMKILEICDFTPLRNNYWVEFWQGEYRQEAEAAVEAARQGGVGHFVGFCPTMLGKPMWWDVVVNPILDAEGKPEKLLSLSRDITERKQAEIMLRALVEGTASVTGKDFFRSMVRHLAAAIPVRYAFVTECADLARTRARILAFWNGEAFTEEFEYDVAKTTCEQVYAGNLCFYQRELQKLFPEETALVELGGESYIGIPLLNSNGDFIGHLAVIDTQAMETPRGLDVLKIFAARAGAELERKKTEDDLRKALAEVEQLKNQLHAENIYLQEEIRREHNFEEIVGSSPALVHVLQQVEQVAPTDVTVLILGETGTGKELIARAIHNRSRRQNRPLVKVNCGAISAGLVESELFGHVKGAFTGAVDKRVGRFELADGGTIFLDEVGELPLDTQVKLLRVLQEGEFEPVGSSRTVKVDVRIIAATNRNLEAEVKAGRFRADLFYRLNVLPLQNPPLRERQADIAQLAMFFLSRYAKRFGKQLDGIAQETMELLQTYHWPGNVRELQNIIERGVVLATGRVLTLERSLLPVATEPLRATTEVTTSTTPATPAKSDVTSLDDIARQHILSVLEQTHWVIEGAKGAAQMLNLHPNTLRSRMKKLGIQRPR
ncbi:MAG TPA: sigma 54-interacting transcriptional regulator [Blastocatellia bacterium]|nr:sigma 54-interacting transcriptional regulator [Blastocatellia bacterium]